MKKIIDVDEDAVHVFIDHGELGFTIVPIKDLPDYEDPKEEEPSLYPADETEYWFITPKGEVFKNIFINSREHRDRFDIGICFFIRGEAEFEVERRKVIAKMKLYAEPIPAKWDCKKKHWNIGYSFLNESVHITNSVSCTWGELYFSSKEQAQKAIDAVGKDNVKKYYLGVIE